MQSLEEALRHKDPEAKIFFALKSLRAGGLWLPELAREIAEATAFVLLVGEKGIGPWQIMEYYEALDRRVKEDGLGEEPTRRRAPRSEFSDEQWRLVSELANHPNRLLVTATPEGGETYAEVAHEAIFKRWDKLRDWIAAEREFLAWRSGLEAARRAWQQAPDRSQPDALLMGFALAQAQGWLAKRPADLPDADRDFIALSRRKALRRKWMAFAAWSSWLTFPTLLVLTIGSGVFVYDRLRWYTTTRPYMLAQVQPYVLTPESERELKPKDSFRECAKDCPEMVVVPAGEFLMGSPDTEPGRSDDEGPQRKVTIPKPFAVSKYEVTFAEWDACVDAGTCQQAEDKWRRGQMPVINVSWDDAQQYVAWFSKMTDKPYRLLSEAEWEYAARAGTTTAYSWGDKIGEGNANCVGCGSEWDGKQTAPVGSFKPNAYGLYDMHGNVWEWVEDVSHDDYEGAPLDGSAWTKGGDPFRAVRGGSWVDRPQNLRAASRDRAHHRQPGHYLGFRLARTLNP